MLGMLGGAALRSVLLAGAVGAALRLRQTCDPRVSFAAWAWVLAASLSMPAVTGLALVVLPHSGIQLATMPLTQDLMARTNVATVVSLAEQGLSAMRHMTPDCYWLAWYFYLALVGVLTLRLLVGLSLSRRIVRHAMPINEDWAAAFDIRVSRHIDAPATFGSVILLPADYNTWSATKRLAVLAHEGSHVTRRDSAVQLAAAVNRIVFWFNPFAWWLQRHLSELAESVSDDAAIAGLGDRVGYAEILLEVSGRVPNLPDAVAMSKYSVVARRIERILSEAPLPTDVSRRGRAIVAACIVPLAISLDCIIISPGPAHLSAVSPAANTRDDVAAATSALRPAPVYSLATVVPETTHSLAVPTAAIAPPVVTEPQPREPEVSITRSALSEMPARLVVSPLKAPGSKSPRRAPHLQNATVVTSPRSRPAVYPAKALAHAAVIAPDVVAGVAGEQDQPPLFETLVNATCGVTDLLRLGPAYLIPRGGPSYLARAHFFRSRDGRPWVTLYYTGGQAANLPVVIKATEIEFIRSYDMIYTLSPSPGNHLVSFAKHPDGGSVDFACRRENSHPS